MADYSDLPDFDSLPRHPGMPQGCSWGLFDTDGQKDSLGCINLLTPRVVREALKEAREGVSVSLDWSIGALARPGVGRKGLVHKVIDLTQLEHGPLHGFDDEVEFNTQCSSQWDSLVHFLHQTSMVGYNGAKPSIDELSQPVIGTATQVSRFPTLDHWHARGGLVGRGVLLDYREYARVKGIRYSPFESHAISVSVLEDVAKLQGTEFKHGDILLLRTGYTEDLTGISGQEQERLLKNGRAIGVEGCKESAKWFWNRHFSAVAGDNLAFEVFPPRLEHENGREAEPKDLGESL